MFFPPFLTLILIVFLGLLFFVFTLVKLGLFAAAFAKLGVDPEHVFSLLILCMAGSMVNIPVRRIPAPPGVLPPPEVVSFFGMRYRVPRRPTRDTVLAVNLGGAVIPSVLSLYLLFSAESPVRMLLALAVVTFVCYNLARPVPGMGIALPVFVPPLVAAASALLLDPASPTATAYVAGTLGTLIGADILNIGKIASLGAPVASIGGAGTFDGIFLTGILAVLIA